MVHTTSTRSQSGMSQEPKDQRLWVRMLAVVAGATKDHHRRAVVDGGEVLVPELLGGLAEVAVHVGVQHASREDLIDRPAHLMLLEELRHLGHLRSEKIG